jgi:hypothetical protein
MERVLRDYQVVMAKAITATCSFEGNTNLSLAQWPDYPTVFQLNIDLGKLDAPFPFIF